MEFPLSLSYIRALAFLLTVAISSSFPLTGFYCWRASLGKSLLKGTGGMFFDVWLTKSIFILLSYAWLIIALHFNTFLWCLFLFLCYRWDTQFYSRSFVCDIQFPFPESHRNFFFSPVFLNPIMMLFRINLFSCIVLGTHRFLQSEISCISVGEFFLKVLVFHLMHFLCLLFLECLFFSY